eukprot:COSAG01_NODE_25063_length_756_cov_198.654490_2_plen_127_part_00
MDSATAQSSRALAALSVGGRARQLLGDEDGVPAPSDGRPLSARGAERWVQTLLGAPPEAQLCAAEQAAVQKPCTAVHGVWRVTARTGAMYARRPHPLLSIWTEIPLCHPCCCHEILRMDTPGQTAA